MSTKPWLAHYDPGVPDVVNIPDVTLPELLAESAKMFPDRTALIFFNNKISYKELDRAVTEFAAGLQSLGLEKGDRVAVYIPNSPQYVISYYGILRAGGVVVPSNIQYVPRELEHQFNDSGARYVVTLSKFYENVKQVRGKTPVEHVIVTNIKEYFPRVTTLLFTLLKEKKDGHRVDITNDRGTYWFQDVLEMGRVRGLDALETSAEDLAVLSYTGGTTGVPKGAMLTHRNLVANVQQLSAWDSEMRPGNEVAVGALPFFHSYGMTTIMNFTLAGGGSIILIPNPRDLKDILKNITRHRATVFPAIPTLYTALNNYPEVSKYDLASLRACISGAAGLPVEVQKKFEEMTGANLREGYGLTEASPVVTANPMKGKSKVGRIGLPLPSTELKVVDLESGEEVPQGESGELLVRGPQVMKGYWNRPEESVEAIDEDGWLHTGDMGRMDEEGYFEIVDRKKDLIIASGFNVYPREVEEVLYEHPKILEAAVAGIPDEYRGETVKAYVVLREGEQATAEEILKFCAERLSPYKRPKLLEFRDELPKSMVGKILRRVLVEEELKKRGTAAA